MKVEAAPAVGMHVDKAWRHDRVGEVDRRIVGGDPFANRHDLVVLDHNTLITIFDAIRNQSSTAQNNATVLRPFVLHSYSRM